MKRLSIYPEDILGLFECVADSLMYRDFESFRNFVFHLKKEERESLRNKVECIRKDLLPKENIQRFSGETDFIAYTFREREKILDTVFREPPNLPSSDPSDRGDTDPVKNHSLGNLIPLILLNGLKHKG